MNIASVSWGDHLTFGEGDGRLDTPDALARRMDAWRTELHAAAVHWRALRTSVPGRFFAARGYRHPSQAAASRISWDDLEAVPRLARARGMESWLYVSLFDEGFPLAPARERRASHHNAMHGQHVAWQSELTRRQPQWVTVDRTGRLRQWGVVCLAYPDARRAFVERWLELLDRTVEDRCQIALGAAANHQLGGGADPALIRSCGSELPVEEISGHRLVVLAHRRRAEAPARTRRSPSARISRATRFSLTYSRASRRSFHTRGRP